MANYVPLYVGGKRDKARRFINPSTGEIISRRKYIKITEGVSLEEKAVRRAKEGKAKPGKTYQRYLERKAKKEKKAKVQPPKRRPYTTDRLRVVDIFRVRRIVNDSLHRCCPL